MFKCFWEVCPKSGHPAQGPNTEFVAVVDMLRKTSITIRKLKFSSTIFAVFHVQK